MFTFTLRTIYPYKGSMARRIVVARGGKLFETDGQKYIAASPFQTNGISALVKNDRHDCKLQPTIIQHKCLHRCSAHICAAATWRERGEEYVGEGTDDHEGWRACHYDATARGGQSVEIYG